MKKTAESAEPSAAAASSAGAVAKPPAVIHAEPTGGGSYTRNLDTGELKLNTAAAATEQPTE